MSQSAIVTWNLHGRPSRNETAVDAMKRVTTSLTNLKKHISKCGIGQAVIIFQELPDRFDAILQAASAGEWTLEKAAEDHIAIVSVGKLTASNSIALHARVSSGGNRAIRLDVDGLLPSPVRIVGVHWLDRLNHPVARPRDFQSGKFWSLVREQWDYPQIKNFVVAGDFNENPYDPPIVSRECLWAIRDRSDLNGRSWHPDGFPPLFNPMWQFLPESEEPPHGTVEYLDNEASGIRWAHLDQVILSPSMTESFKGIKILTELDGSSLVNKRGSPSLVAASDHLPVIAFLGA